MAPNGNLKARNGVGVGHGKINVSRRVVPAIPLTYERRVKANAAAKLAAVQTQAGPVASLPRPVAAVTNGSSLKIQYDVDSAPPTPKTAEPEVNTRDDRAAAHDRPDESAAAAAAPATPTLMSQGDDREHSQDTAAKESSSTLPVSTDPHVSQSTDKPTEQDASQSVEDSARDVGSNHVPSPSMIRAAQTEDQPQLPTAFRPPPLISPTRYNMPPGAHNGPRPSSVVINGTSHRGSRPVHNGNPQMHGPRPSNGSLVQFGGFGSNSSSPVPPHSGGFMPPPPGAPLHDGRPFPHAAAVNGYHPQMPYGTEFVPGTAVDQFGRPIPSYAGMEQYPPPPNGYGPSTPHSFHGSHSSAQAEENGPYNRYPAPGINNNGPAHVDDARPHAHPAGAFGAPPQRMMPGPLPPPHMMHPAHEMQGLEGLAAYLRSQFRDTAFADCTLELRYLDDRAPPVRIPGHRLVLARSRVLRSILESETFESSPPGGANRTILLQSEDRYLRSDAFWMAVQHLYAFPLLELPEPSANGVLSLAGSTIDRFDFALGYTAAGHVLGWHPIVVRGLEIASHSLSWTTLERALEFALGDVPGRASADRHTQFGYGEAVQILLNGIISFIINNYPPDFTLDTSVGDPERFARIPFASTSPPAREGTPAIARGTSSQDRRSRAMRIQFGDLALSSDSSSKAPETTPLSPQQRSIQLTLSTILINLPFAYLKIALESSGYGNVNGWASVEARHQIMRAVVNEREARRIQAVEAVKAGMVPHAESILRGLQSAEPRQSEVWHGLGWCEEVVSYVNGDAPSLGRQWVPLMAQTAHGADLADKTARPGYP